jgi:predicted transcriptional regulator
MKLRKDVSMTVRVSDAMKDALQRIADSERRTLSQLVGIVLEEYLESRHEWPPKPERARKAATARRR